MMRLASNIFCAFGLLLAGANLQAQSLLPCGAQSSSSAIEAAGIRRLISGSAASDSAWRAHANLPKMDASAVVFVSSDSVCDAAAHAVANLSTPAAPVVPVWVLAAGPDRYIVFGTQRMSEGWGLAAVFDSSFTWLADFVE